jgi:hypothetical protein
MPHPFAFFAKGWESWAPAARVFKIRGYSPTLVLSRTTFIRSVTPQPAEFVPPTTTDIQSR